MRIIVVLIALLTLIPSHLVAKVIELMYYKGKNPYIIKKEINLPENQLKKAEIIIKELLKRPADNEQIKTYIPEDARLYDISIQKNRIIIILETEKLPPPSEVVYYDEMQRQIINTLSGHLEGIEVYDIRFFYKGRVITIDEALDSKRDLRIKQNDGCNILRLNSKDAPYGTLTGKRIVVSPGHGYYYDENLGWTTQRDNINGLIEDLLTADICNNWLIPYLERAGAHVISVRERDFSIEEYIMDNSSPQGYSEKGSFSDGTSPGGYANNYRVAKTNTIDATSIAEYTINLPMDNFFRLSIWWVPGSNRSEDTRLTVQHSGGETVFLINQKEGTPTWFYLPQFYFSKQAIIKIDNLSSKEGNYIIADAVRLGGGKGSIERGGSTSGRPRWQEAARYFIQYAGAPSSIYDALSADNNDDVVARPKYADWAKGDLYVSVHTNAYNNTSTGTETYYYNGTIYPGSDELAYLIQKQIVDDIRKEYDPGWTDRGVKSANFGELRECKTMPSALTELAFHDGITGVKDNEYLHDTKFKRLMGRAVYRAIAKYFDATKPFIPEPPDEIYAESPEVGVLRVTWGTVPGATGYRVYLSEDGFGFDNGRATSDNSIEIKCLRPGLIFVKVTATNEGGESLDSQVLAVTIKDIRKWTPILIVNAFDRLDAMVQIEMNRGNWIIPHAKALYKNGYFFDSATNEAFTKYVESSRYTMIDWLCGLESTRDETFSKEEQLKIADFLARGGSLFLSGSEIAWDLDYKGDEEDRKFFSDWIRASYSADSAGVYKVIPSAQSIFAGIGEILFDDGTHGTYPVKYPDVINPVNNSRAELIYDQNKGIAALSFSEAYKIIYFGFPFETIYDEKTRSDVMGRVANFLAGDAPRIEKEVDYSCCNPLERVCLDEKSIKVCSATGTYSEIEICEKESICKDGHCIPLTDHDGGIEDITEDTTLADTISTDIKEDVDLTSDSGPRVCENGERICEGNNVKVCVRNYWYIGAVCGSGTRCLNGICISQESVDGGAIVESDSSGCGCTILY